MMLPKKILLIPNTKKDSKIYSKKKINFYMMNDIVIQISHDLHQINIHHFLLQTISVIYS